LVVSNGLTSLPLTSWLLNASWVPIPTPSPSVPPFKPKPTPTSTSLWIPGGHHPPITTPSPSPSPSPSASPSPSPSSSPPVYSVKLGIYENDPSAGQPKALQSIDWGAGGPIVPGQKRNSSRVYFRNEGTVPFTLSISTSNWVFQDSAGNSLSSSYSQYFTLTWDCGSSAMGVGETRAVTLTLAVSWSLTNVAAFSFDLVVTMTY
jgi:hypothetical protein